MMFPRLSLILLIGGGASIAFAEVPRKLSQAKLRQLSIFPVAEEKKLVPPPKPHPADDYTLAGITKVEDGWFVVLLHKKDRSNRIRLSPHDFTTSGFQVISVENATTRDVRVEIEADGRRTWVGYDPKVLTVRKANTKSADSRAPSVR